MIEIAVGLKAKFKDVRSHLQLLANPLLAENKSLGIQAIRDDQGKVIEGALRYGESIEGPTAALLGGIHMNEMAGVFALHQFHHRWLNGIRPKSGTILVATGKIERALEFVDLVMASDSLPKQLWGSFRATKDHCNYNRIPHDILTKGLSSEFERHTFQIIKHVLRPANGRVLDLHNTSEDAAPMVTLFMDRDETPEASIDRLNTTGVTRGLPIADFIIWKPGPYNGMESIRSVIKAESGALSILIENGGVANPDSLENADMFTQIWLRNVLGMEPEKEAGQRASHAPDRKHYIETDELYHPTVKPDDYAYLTNETMEAARNDKFILVRDWQSLNDTTGWSDKARKIVTRLAQQDLREDRLDNFTPIKKGDIIALGLKSGLELCSPRDGVVMMVGTSPALHPQDRETFANIGIVL